MKIQLDRNKEFLDVKKVTIVMDNKEFEISVNKFGQLEINKCYSEEDGALKIIPSVSNEIRVE
ncbi:hypothetical protein HZP37_14580 [Elizabethkingia anophelis]|uniref:hypothetical protein n=1 Tax=Elizabethkingia anophelis TaxID=1117645 RepID=UPI0021A7F057|nr:hypothetical protein [Elizabethkingia anophelis]MCT3875102.1 hypothetical protein [Elizabethkingia anophelis]MCT4252315.1 hypothetical protein [Elizabethkingia anophelis]MCT4261608.1 hypothetical protein [Elizabethkingia anophelis]